MKIIPLLLVALSGPALAAEPPTLETPPKGLASSDWSSIRAAYEAGRHAIHRQENGTLTSRNPGQQWRTEFDGKGFLTTPDHGQWTWGLELTGYGERTLLSASSSITHEGGKISCQRDENLTERFINDTRGLEQGWTIQEKPVGRSGPERRDAETGFSVSEVGAAGRHALPLVLQLSTRGDLRPIVSTDSSSVSFQTASGGTALAYGGLKAWDADGTNLLVRFEPAGENAIRIAVEDQNARYPITIDPIAQQAYLKASNTWASDSFGRSVAVSGDTVVVGAYLEDSSTTGVNSTSNNSADGSGAAYVFTRSGTTWSQQAYLKASNPGESDFFGIEVAVSGDTVVVGAPGEASSTTGVNSTPNLSADSSGAAYVFDLKATNAPEIAVQQAGADIATNATQAFGPLVVGTSADLIFTILNTGIGALTLNGTPRVAVTGSPDFTITAQPASTITGPSGSTTFTVRFAPSSIGSKNAVLSIPNDDTNENPFTINLSGSGVTALTAYNNAVLANSSLTGSNALPAAMPFNDGVENLLKYAFNMNLSGPDSHTLVSGTGNVGLPAIGITGTGPATMIRVEFLRRKGSGLIYTPMRSSTLAPGSFVAMSGTPVVTSIDANWERVVVQESANPATLPRSFATVEVELP